MSEELNELIEMARTIRMTPEQGIPCLERRETWGTRGAALPMAHARSLDFARDDMSWQIIDWAAEELEKEKWAGGVLLVWTGDFAVPEFIYVAYGTTEVVPFPNSDTQSFFAATEVVPYRILAGEGVRATQADGVRS